MKDEYTVEALRIVQSLPIPNSMADDVRRQLLAGFTEDQIVTCMMAGMWPSDLAKAHVGPTPKPITAADLMADLERLDREMAPLRAELDRIARDLFGAVEKAATRQGVSWDEAARRMLAVVPADKRGECIEVINAARARARGGGRG